MKSIRSWKKFHLKDCRVSPAANGEGSSTRARKFWRKSRRGKLAGGTSVGQDRLEAYLPTRCIAIGSRKRLPIRLIRRKSRRPSLNSMGTGQTQRRHLSI